jgi:thymidylate synthase ThyX
MTRTRYGISFAQQAMRVADMTQFEVDLPQTVIDADCTADWNELMRHIRAVYALLRSRGVPAQDARGVLPLNTYTSLLARYDLRALADMLSKRDNLRAQGEYAGIARQMKAEVYRVHPWTRLFIEPERKRTPELDEILKEQLNGSSPVDKPKINAALKQVDALKATWG